MKKSKRFLAILMALSLTAALAACTPDETGDTSTTPPVDQQTDEATLAPDETGAIGASESNTQQGDSTQEVSGTQDASATLPQGQEKPSKESTTAPKANADPAKMSKAELVNYYNTAANDAKKSAKSITKTQNQASLAKRPEINNGFLESVANGLMKTFLSDAPKAINETYSSAAEKNANFYVAGQSYSSKLTAADVTSATCKKSGGSYIVTLKVKGSSVSKAFSTISKSQITDAVGGAVKFNSIDIVYSTSTIQATIGSNGKLQKVNYYMPNVTMKFDVKLITDIQASLAIHLGDWFTINW